jgi:hypothetical protein
MDILEPKDKSSLDDALKTLFKKLKFKRFPIILNGSASLKSQRYFSDYDLFSLIPVRHTAKQAFNEFGKILNDVLKTEDLYFVELKLQTKDGKKIKWLPDDTIKFKEFENDWANVDFVKIDLILRTQNRFIEVSIIYKFYDDSTKSDKDAIDELKQDLEELEKEGRYYKVLKRLFSIANIRGDKKTLKKLNRVFNSNLGALYQKISNLEAIEKLLQVYNDPTTKKKVEINLKDIKETSDISKIPTIIARDSVILNKSAKEIYKTI